MTRSRAMLLLFVLALSFAPLAVFVDQAQAAAACCQINSNGTPRPAGSFRCNLSAAETRRVGVGQYEVDFTPVSTDIRNFPRSAVQDTQTIGFSTGEITVADRVGDLSSVFVATFNSAGQFADRAFDICIY